MTATISYVSTCVAAERSQRTPQDPSISVIEPREKEIGEWRDRDRTEVYLPEGAAPDLAAQLILGADDPIHGAAPRRAGQWKLGFGVRADERVGKGRRSWEGEQRRLKLLEGSEWIRFFFSLTWEWIRFPVLCFV